MPYERYETQLFTEQLAEIRRLDKKAAEQLDGATVRIIEHPEVNDGSLKGDRAGSFKKKAVDRKYRIIWRYCQWCIKVRQGRCQDCAAGAFPESVVILEEVRLRRDGYD